MIETPEQFVKAFNKHKSVKAVARKEGLTWHNARGLYMQAVDAGLLPPLRVGAKSREELKAAPPPPEPTGRIKKIEAPALPLPPEGMIAKYLFSCVQNDTLLHPQLMENINALLAHYEADPRVAVAQLHVARITYVRAGLGATGDKADLIEAGGNPAKAYKQRVLDQETLYGAKDMTFPEEGTLGITEYSDKRLQIAPGLVWCGESNTLPTVERPLSGFESYTGRKSGIFPHTKVALESIPSMADEGTKFNYTTGALTLRNHIQRKAGLKADFHHCYGALLAEVNSDGDWWCRQVVADSDGTIYDLDVRVKDGVVEEGKFVHSITWGDVHAQIMDEENAEACWGEGGILDTFQPKFQFVHDLFNCGARNHHEKKDPMRRFILWDTGMDSVKDEVVNASGILEHTIERPWCETVVVNSNHDRHLGRWLKEEDARYDAVNFSFWSEMWQASLSVAQDTGEEPNYFELAMNLVGYKGSALFLPRDGSFVICPDDGGGIECGMHGDEGPNGSRGSAGAFARMGRKMNVAHTHRAGIWHGVYTAGTSSKLRPVYVHGPDAASHSHIFTYENGKRCIVTIWGGKHRA